jgi:hypothetical protein
MDKETRNRLRHTVTQCRTILERAIAEILQGQFGIHDTGLVEDPEAMTHLSAEDREYREQSIIHLQHIKAANFKPAEAVQQLAREAAFTHLNRLCAYKMMEVRGLIRAAVSKGIKSQGFMFYMADHPEDENLWKGSQQDVAYRHFLLWLGGSFVNEIPALFSPDDPANRLFPPQRVLDQVLSLINGDELNDIWAEDETIGRIYQYYNDQEERRKMRDPKQGGSAAPRNSRELAVRNQFFTPRYVVEFLTDNTLGRIWYEMTRSETKLDQQCSYLVRRPKEIFLKPGESGPELKLEDRDQKLEDVSQEQLLNRPVFIPHPVLKDPRTILMLDPACGSMHFGLYAFDVFEVIYEEAWALEEKLGEDSLCRPPTMQSLHRTYSTKEDFLKHVPCLTIEHNLHGIDIDGRCTQIAGLSLWLRAQKSWQRLGLKREERPAIKRSNIVCAEPMPGEKELLREFVHREFLTEEHAVFERLLGVVFEKMKLAGEAGSLLKIEEEIRSAISDAKKLWRQGPTLEQTKLFGEPEGLRQSDHRIDLSGVSDDQFWERVEERIYDALRNYAEQAGNGGGFQRRLFAEDAARGFAFIDVCRKRYDVVVMNPPFGDRVVSCEVLFEREYGDGKLDLYHYFYDRADELRSDFGRVGAITPRTLLYQAHYLGLREKWLNGEVKPEALAELDVGVLDSATVRPALVVLGESSLETRTFYRNLKHSLSPAKDLLEAVTGFRAGQLGSRCTFHVLSRFAEMPGKRFSLWATDRILKSFLQHKTLEPALGKVTEGLSNEDDRRFLRCWWETPIATTPRWLPFGKFDARSTFVPDFSIVIDWSPSAYTLLGQLGNRRANENFYFRSGCAFTRSCEVGMAATTLPLGVVFSGVSRYFLPSGDALLGLLAYLNTRLAEGLHLVLTPDRDRISGTLRKLPVVINEETLVRLQSAGTEIWREKVVWLASTDETQRIFWDALRRIVAEGGPSSPKTSEL